MPTTGKDPRAKTAVLVTAQAGLYYGPFSCATCGPWPYGSQLTRSDAWDWTGEWELTFEKYLNFNRLGITWDFYMTTSCLQSSRLFHPTYLPGPSRALNVVCSPRACF